jgi:uncharacterized DUF497 family protein
MWGHRPAAPSPEEGTSPNSEARSMTSDESDDDAFQSHQIEWDENKRHANLAKHGIDFLDVAEIFSDPRRRTFRSHHPPDERRYVTLGLLRHRLIAVIWTMRGDKLRVISMRRARRNESKRYEEAI